MGGSLISSNLDGLTINRNLDLIRHTARLAKQAVKVRN
jgi:hypothetical protein